MADSDKTVSYGVNADASGFEQGMKLAADASKNAASEIDASFKKVQDVFANVQKQLILLASVVAGGAFFKKAIDASNELTGEVVSLSKQLGVSTKEASTLNVALKSIGSSADVYTSANAKLVKQIRTNEDGVKAMGVQTRAANGEFLSGEAIMTNAITALKGYKEGTDRNLAAQTLFGKGAAEATALLKLNSEVMDQARIKAEQLGLVIGPEQASNTKAYKDAMNQVKLVLTAFENQIGQAVMPAFTQLATWFADTGPAVIAVFKPVLSLLSDSFMMVIDVVRGVGSMVGDVFSSIGSLIGSVAGKDVPGALQVWTNVMTLVKVALLGLQTGTELAFEVIRGVLLVAIERIKQFGAVAKAAFSLDWAGVKSAWTTGTASVEAVLAESQKRMMEKTAALAEKMQRVLMGGPMNEPKSVKAAAPGGGKGYTEPADSKGAAKATSRSAQWETELAEQKLAFQERMNLQGSFEQFSKAAELKFWQDKLAITKAGGAENITVRKKLADLQLGINQAAFEHEVASLIAQEAAFKNNTAAKLAILNEQAALVKERYGAESKEYEAIQKKIVETKRVVTQQLKQIDLERSTGARNADLAELQGREQIAQLERELGTITQADMLARQATFENQRAAIALQGLKERQTIALADPDRNIVELEKIQQDIEQAERQHQLRLGEIRKAAVMDAQKYTLGAVSSLSSGFQNVFNQAMQGSLSLRGVVQGTFAAVGNVVTQTLSKMAADWLAVQLANLLIGKTTAVSTIGQKSAEAGAGGVASMAAAPFPLNLGAPAFGAAMSIAAMSFAPLASASGGYDIPGTINPITQLHAREMVLPAKHADVIRAMADGGGGGAQVAPLAFTVNTVDARGVRDFFNQHGAALVDALHGQRRNFKF